MIRALESARNHIIFAQDSDDTSQNMKDSAQAWLSSTNDLLERLELVMALSDEIVQSQSLEEVTALAKEIRLLVWENLNGWDSNADGVIGKLPDEWGMKQLSSELNAITDRENPPYQPVEQRYLFGIFRLPSGKWAFSDSVNSPDSDPDLGGGGY